MTTDLDVLVRKFTDGKPLAEDVASEVTSIMNAFALSAEDLAYKWESHVMNLGRDDLVFSAENLRQLSRDLQADLESAHRAKKAKTAHGTPQQPGSARRGFPGSGGSPASFIDQMLTPAPTNRRRNASQTPMSQTPSRPASGVLGTGGQGSSPPPSSPGMRIANSADAGTVLETLNPHIAAEQRAAERGAPARFESNINVKRFGYRTMYQKLSEASEVLDQQIEDMAAALVAARPELEADMGNPAVASQEPVVAVGRIAPESLAEKAGGHGNKLSAQSLMLQTSRRAGAGERVRLNLDAVASYSLFAGQIVALRGVNASGDYFAVQEVLELPLLPPAATPASELRATDGQLQVVAAAGPFTTGESLDFAPLDALVARINATKPDAAVLVGPFLDFTHAAIRSGALDDNTGDAATLDDFFRARVVPKLAAISPDTTVVLIPHVRDVASKHAAYPQKGLDRKALGLPKHFKCVPNPATFTLNGVVFCATSAEAIQDLSRASVTKKDPTAHAQSSAFTLAFQHVIAQRRVYPVFPVPLPASADPNADPNAEPDAATDAFNPARVALDVPYLPLGNINHAVPDVLIIPSVMKQQAQVIHNVVAVNPGQVAKQSTTGAYASISVNPLPPSSTTTTTTTTTTAADGLVPHRAWDRTRVDIIKL